MNQIINQTNDRMTSLDVAQFTGMEHKNILRAIRAMEPAWEKVHGRKFEQVYRDVPGGNGAIRKMPCFHLTKTEWLYIGTKFNDEARAKLVLRWEELENKARPLTQSQLLLQSAQMLVDIETRQLEQEQRLKAIEQKSHEAEERLQDLELPSPEQLPAIDETQKIIRAVNDHCARYNLKQHDVWRKIYSDLYYIYHIRIEKKENISKLQQCKQRGILDKVLRIVSNLVK